MKDSDKSLGVIHMQAGKPFEVEVGKDNGFDINGMKFRYQPQEDKKSL